MKTSRWDIETLRVILVLAALAAVVTLVTGVVGVGYTADEGIGLERLDDNTEADGVATMSTTVKATDFDLASTDGFVPTAVEGEIVVEGLARTLQLISTGVIIVGLLVAGVAFFGILTDAAKADPFVRRNVRRWHIVAGGLALGLVGMFIASFAHLEAKSAAGMAMTAEWDIRWVVAVLAAGAMARIWDIGVGLREEQAYTI